MVCLYTGSVWTQPMHWLRETWTKSGMRNPQSMSDISVCHTEKEEAPEMAVPQTSDPTVTPKARIKRFMWPMRAGSLHSGTLGGCCGDGSSGSSHDSSQHSEMSLFRKGEPGLVGGSKICL